MLISVLAAAAFAAGCGDDDSSASLTKAEYVKKGDAICKEANEQGRQELLAYLKQNKAQTLSQDDEKELISTVIVPLIEKQIEGLEGLETPEGDNGQADAIIEELEEVRVNAEENPVGAKAKGSPFAEVQQTAQKYGFEDCGHN